MRRESLLHNCLFKLNDQPRSSPTGCTDRVQSLHHTIHEPCNYYSTEVQWNGCKLTREEVQLLMRNPVSYSAVYHAWQNNYGSYSVTIAILSRYTGRCDQKGKACGSYSFVQVRSSLRAVDISTVQWVSWRVDTGYWNTDGSKRACARPVLYVRARYQTDRQETRV